jgi:hypothetical protein
MATILTFGVHQVFGQLAAQPYVLIIDASLFAVGLKIALASNCHWPLWFCGFTLVSLATSIASLIFPTEIPALYIDLAGFWSIPTVASAAIGVVLDSREVGRAQGEP